MGAVSANGTRPDPHRPPPAGLSGPATHGQLSQQIAALNDLAAPQLRAEWRRLYRSQPPRLSRDLLVRSIAYRMQELAYGGLSKATRRRLSALAEEPEANGSVVPERSTRVRPGMRLVREWHGRTHTVVVTEDGFEYAGRAYASLTKIAQEITGAHWSGPRFFGLGRKEAPNVQSANRMLASGEDSHG
jgi:Protein of unknown function (DUF2924)